MRFIGTHVGRLGGVGVSRIREAVEIGPPLVGGRGSEQVRGDVGVIARIQGRAAREQRIGVRLRADCQQCSHRSTAVIGQGAQPGVGDAHQVAVDTMGQPGGPTGANQVMGAARSKAGIAESVRSGAPRSLLVARQDRVAEHNGTQRVVDVETAALARGDTLGVGPVVGNRYVCERRLETIFVQALVVAATVSAGRVAGDGHVGHDDRAEGTVAPVNAATVLLGVVATDGGVGQSQRTDRKDTAAQSVVRLISRDDTPGDRDRVGGDEARAVLGIQTGACAAAVNTPRCNVVTDHGVRDRRWDIAIDPDTAAAAVIGFVARNGRAGDRDLTTALKNVAQE